MIINACVARVSQQNNGKADAMNAFALRHAIVLANSSFHRLLALGLRPLRITVTKRLKLMNKLEIRQKAASVTPGSTGGLIQADLCEQAGYCRKPE